jgi:hypothetical protein
MEKEVMPSHLLGMMPQTDVNESSTDTQVVDEQEQGVGGRESSRPDLLVFGLVESVVGQESLLVVFLALNVEDGLRHEGVGETVPDVPVVDRGHEDVGEH